jgi:hypothetical protein
VGNKKLYNIDLKVVGPNSMANWYTGMYCWLSQKMFCVKSDVNSQLICPLYLCCSMDVFL